jgi:flagellar basal body-associated protein FliL
MIYLQVMLRLLLLLILSVLPLQVQANAEPKEEEVAAGPQFIPVGPLTVPIVRNGKIFQYVRISIKLEAKDGADALQITDRLPSLNDAYLSNLYGAFYAGQGMSGPLVDLEKIKKRLEIANSKVLPAGVVQNIFIQQVNQSAR